MNLAAYILTCDDDTDVLVNAVRSLVGVANPILLCDMGDRTTRHHGRRQGMTSVTDFYRFGKKNMGWPLEYTNVVAVR